MSIWAISLLLCAFVVVAVVRKEAERRTFLASTDRLEVSADGVVRDLVDGRREAVSWDEVRSVEVVLAAHGPHKASGGVLLLDGGLERGCLIPLDRLGSSGVVPWLSQLPGFDVGRLTRALDEQGTARAEAGGDRAGTSFGLPSRRSGRRSDRTVVWERTSE